jgi:hypothetical protein
MLNRAGVSPGVRCLAITVRFRWPNRTKIKSLQQVRGPQMGSAIRVLQCESKGYEDAEALHSRHASTARCGS